MQSTAELSGGYKHLHVVVHVFTAVTMLGWVQNELSKVARLSH